MAYDGELNLADRLEIAADRFERGGWVKNRFAALEGVCFVGAVAYAYGITPGKYGFTHDEIMYLSWGKFTDPAIFGFESVFDMCTWNNAPERTQAEVTARIRAGANFLRTEKVSA